jgi:hypothetical protein
VNPNSPVDIAAEAEFLLNAAQEKLKWVLALASAIDLDLEHGMGRRSRDLAALATFLSDIGFCDMDEEIEAFRKIAQPAPVQHGTGSSDRDVEASQ